MDLDLIKGKEGKETNLRTLFSIFIEKKAVQVGFKPTTSYFQGSHSTNWATEAAQLVGFKSHKLHKLCKAKCLISPDKQGKLKLNI